MRLLSRDEMDRLRPAETVARLYRYDRRAELGGSRRLAELKAQYDRSGIGRSNRR
jgi:hypothetical protein